MAVLVITRGKYRWFLLVPREVEQYLVAKDYGKAMETLETYRLGPGRESPQPGTTDDWSHTAMNQYL